MEFLDKVKSEQFSNRRQSKLDIKNVDVQYEIMKKLPTGTAFIGKGLNPGLSKLLTFAKRNNIDNEEYKFTHIPRRAPRMRISGILRGIRDEQTQKTPVYHPNLYDKNNASNSEFDEQISTGTYDNRKFINKNRINNMSHHSRHNSLDNENQVVSNLKYFSQNYKSNWHKIDKWGVPMKISISDFTKYKLRKISAHQSSVPDLILPHLSSKNKPNNMGCPFTFRQKEDEISLNDSASMISTIKLKKWKSSKPAKLGKTINKKFMTLKPKHRKYANL
jgi:hypothetical protein